MKNKTAKHVRQKRKKQKPGFMLQREQLHSNATGLLRFLFFLFFSPSFACSLSSASRGICCVFCVIEGDGVKANSSKQIDGPEGEQSVLPKNATISS